MTIAARAFVREVPDKRKCSINQFLRRTRVSKTATYAVIAGPAIQTRFFNATRQHVPVGDRRELFFPHGCCGHYNHDDPRFRNFFKAHHHIKLGSAFLSVVYIQWILKMSYDDLWRTNVYIVFFSLRVGSETQYFPLRLHVCRSSFISPGLLKHPFSGSHQQ